MKGSFILDKGVSNNAVNMFVFFKRGLPLTLFITLFFSYLRTIVFKYLFCLSEKYTRQVYMPSILF